jgi:tetratricopeptide (TPR) repeat protein
VPLFALAAASSTVTVFAQLEGGALNMNAAPLSLRLANAAVSVAGYLGKAVLPRGLAMYYPFPEFGLPAGRVLIAAAILAGLTLLAAAVSRRMPFVTAGWAWWLGMLVPVVGLVKIGGQAMADRYTYLPLIGLLVAAFWGATVLAVRPWRRGVATLLALLVILGAAGLCRRQTAFWADSESVFGRALEVTERNWVILNNYALVLERAGKIDQAEEALRRSVALNPRAGSMVNLGNLLARSGRLPEAREKYLAALSLDPASLEAAYNLANILSGLGDSERAIAMYREVLSRAPDNGNAWNNLGVTYRKMGREDEAGEAFREAVRLDPLNIQALNNYGTWLLDRGFPREAITQFRAALGVAPRYPAALGNLADALYGQGDLSGAVELYRALLAVDPADGRARRMLDEATARLGGAGK